MQTTSTGPRCSVGRTSSALQTVSAEGIPLAVDTAVQPMVCCPFGRLFVYCPKISGVESLERPGICPPVSPFAVATDANICRLQCQSDESCGRGQKCCFNGCGLSCLSSGTKSTENGMLGAEPNVFTSLNRDSLLSGLDRHQVTSIGRLNNDARGTQFHMGECPRMVNLTERGYDRCKSASNTCSRGSCTRK